MFVYLNSNLKSLLLWQVVKFTKSFELLSPKCSADTDNRLVLMSSVIMVNYIFHIVFRSAWSRFYFLMELCVDLIEECEPTFLLRQDTCLLQMEACLNEYICLYFFIYVCLCLYTCTDVVSVSQVRNHGKTDFFMVELIDNMKLLFCLINIEVKNYKIILDCWSLTKLFCTIVLRGFQ